MNTITLYEPVQANKAFNAAYQHIKGALLQGKRFVLQVKEETRSNAQNSKLWAMLTDIANQVDWHGQDMSAEDWKHVFSASLKKQRAVPGLDGGFVVLGQRTSKMTKAEMSDMFELMYSFGADKGVKWSASEHDYSQ